MTVKEIKSETQERFTVYRYKAMPAYCVLFFLIVNIAVVTALLCALLVTLPWYVSAILWWYGCLLMLLVLFFSGPFSYSTADYFLKAYNAHDSEASFTFEGFNKFNFARASMLFLLRFLLIFILTCLLIFPGIIFSVKTSMAYQLMRANPKMTAVKAMKASSKIMKGHSFLYFKLIMSFIGWFLLCILTLGAGFIYIMPYFNACKVVFYKKAVLSAKANDTVSAPTEAVVAEDVPVEDTKAENSAVIELPADENTDEVKENNFEESEKFVVQQPAIILGESDSVESNGETVVSIEPVEVVIETNDRVDSVVRQAAEENSVTEEKAEMVHSVTSGDSEKVTEEEKRAAAAKEEIKQRIERLKRERGKNASRPEPARLKIVSRDKLHERNRHEVPSQTTDASSVHSRVTDEFGPEKIEVEILEED